MQSTQRSTTAFALQTRGLFVTQKAYHAKAGHDHGERNAPPMLQSVTRPRPVGPNSPRVDARAAFGFTLARRRPSFGTASLHALLALSLLLAATPTRATSTSDAAGATSSVRSDFIMLTVDKAKLHAELRTWPPQGAPSTLLASFRIAIGKEEGDKEREGDNRTPEGLYFTQPALADEDLPAKYGPRAVPIDFPNPIDRFARKTGYGIWLHGVEADTRVEQAKVTEGCVAFYNSDILRLTDWLKPRQSLVVIANGGGDNAPTDVDAVYQASKAWADAWAKRDLATYMAFYSPDFEHDGKRLAAWHAYKDSVFKSYKLMTVTFDQMRVATHPKYALTVMNQDFRGDNRFRSRGRKMLYWQKAADGRWLVVREVFGSGKWEPRTFSETEMAALNQVSAVAR